MKKFLLLIAATALAGTTYAQSITFKKGRIQLASAIVTIVCCLSHR